MRFSCVCFAAGMLIVSSVAHAQSNLFLMISPSGEYIGQGQTYYTTNQSDIGISGTTAMVTTTAFGFFVYLDAPGTSNLMVGQYTNAVTYPGNGSMPGIRVSGNGRGCSPVCGNFQVFEIHTDGSGNVDRFWATFSQRYPCNGSPLTGEIRYNSQLAPPIPLSRTLYVPGDFATIQAALDNVNMLAIDSVVVDPGLYNESVQFGAKRALLVSAEGPSATYIMAPTGAVAVTFAGATSDAILCGFTLMDSATGVSISSGSPTIISNAIVNCGTGIDFNSGSSSDRSGSPVIRDNSIIGCSGSAISLMFSGTPLLEGNDLEDNGGGISMWEAGAPVIRNNIIRHNCGDGISMVNDCNADIVQNLIVENAGNGITDATIYGTRGSWVVNNTIVANVGAGISSGGGGQIIINNIVVGNPALSFRQSLPVIQFNDIYSPYGVAYAGMTNLTGINGNISTDPFLACQPGGDYHLLADSPCIDSGTNGAALLPATDFDGGTRIQVGHTNGSAVVDLGAFEFNLSTPPVACLFLHCPSNLVVIAASGQNSAVVNYPPSFATPGAIVTNSPPSGSVFPAGTNTVTCTAVYGTNVLDCSFTIIILVPPSITNQPKSVVILAGYPTNLTVGAQGTAPLGYQWLFEGVPIATATNATLTLANPQATNEGYYSVLVSNSAGSITSTPALFRVLPAAPNIIAGPFSLTVSAGSNAVFSVTAAGSASLLFQWFHDGSLIPGAGLSQLVISNAQAADAGNYQVVVSNSMGTATSSITALNVLPGAPIFKVHPTGPAGVLPYGTNFTLSALASGTEPIAYQWRQSGSNLPGATQTTLTLSNVNNSANGNYDVIATNTIGTATSHIASIYVFGTPPSFTQQPVSIEVLEGSTITLNSLATGSTPIQYQWYFNSNKLTDATGRQITLVSVKSASVGPYFVIATNAYGAATSAVAQVTVNQSLVIQQPLTNQIVDVGGAVALVVGASSSNALSYSWQFNGLAIPETNSTLAITNIQPSQTGYYRVTVANQYGSISSTGRVSVLNLPSWVIAWGDNSGGQTNVPLNLDDIIAVVGGDYHSLALHRDGTLSAWGYNSDGQTNVPMNSLRFVSIAAGAGHNLAITENGSVMAWGRNDSGQCNVPTSATNLVLAVAAGDSHSLALLASGSMVAWGDNSFGQVSGTSGLTGIRAIAAGRNHNLALRNNGTVTGWGFNASGQATVPPSLSNVAAIAAGYLHSVALCSNGTVVVWGDNTFEQTNVPAGLSNVIAIAAGDFDTLALHADGSVIGWGNDWYGQTDVPSTVTNAVGIASGYYHGLALIPVIPFLQPYLTLNGLVIQWHGPGILQWAPTPVGPYTDILCSGRCYTNTDISAPAKFFRLRR
jgi:alpha-tubulin suppressor-like RCC1 family protein